MTGDQIKIDNDKILEVADHYKQLASAWTDIADAIDYAGMWRDGAFGGQFRATWADLYTLLYNCGYETAANLSAYSRTLEGIVEANTLTEAAISQSFENLQEEIFTDGYERSSSQLADSGNADLESAPDASENLPEYVAYDAALDPDGVHGNHIVE